jgi:hypothetical protein
MADSRLYLEHVDTGERVLLAKRFGSTWRAWAPTNPGSEAVGLPDSLDAFFERHAGQLFATVTDEGVDCGTRTFRLVYEDSERPTGVPDNKHEAG